MTRSCDVNTFVGCFKLVPQCLDVKSRVFLGIFKVCVLKCFGDIFFWSVLIMDFEVFKFVLRSSVFSLVFMSFINK